MLTVSAVSLGAEDYVRFTWYSQDEAVSQYRWQAGAEDEEKWTVVDASVTSVTLPSSESTVLYVQASTDGVTWSPSGYAVYTAIEEPLSFDAADTEAVNSIEETEESQSYDTVNTGVVNSIEDTEENERERFSFRFSLSPYTLALYRFYNGYSTSSTRTRTGSVYGASCNVELNVPLSSWLSIYPELGCDFVIKEDTIIPGARNVYYLRAGIGLDFTHTINTRYTLYTGLYGGAIAHINNKKASITPYFGARLGFEYELSEHFSLGAVSRVSFALFSTRSESLMASMTVLIVPVSLTLTCRF